MSKDSFTNKAHLVDGDMEADIEGPGIPCLNTEVLRLQCAWTDTASPVGTLYVQGSEDDVLYTDLELTAEMIHSLTGDAALSGGALALDGTAAGGCLLIMRDLPGFVRVFWNVTSGGAADTLNIVAGGR